MPPASTFFCVPMVCGLAFSLKEGRFSEAVDLFADPVWDAVRARVVAKAQEMRRRGFYGPAMLPMEELEYTGIAERLKELEREFS